MIKSFRIFILYLLHLSVAADLPPKTSSVFLDIYYPSSVQALKAIDPGSAVKVCSDNKTLSLDIVYGKERANLSSFLLYDAVNLTNLLGNLENIKFPIFSASECLIIFRQDNSTGSMDSMGFFTINKGLSQPNFCKTPSLLLDPYDDLTNSISATSTSNGSCETILIASPNYYPRRIWIAEILTTSKIITFKSAINNNFLMNLTANDVDLWKNFGIYTEALSVTILPRSNITILLSTISITNNSLIQYESDIQKGIMVSPSYSGRNQDYVCDVVYNCLDTYSITSNDSFFASFYVHELNGVIKLIYSFYKPNDLEYELSNYEIRYHENLTVLTKSFNLQYGDEHHNPDNFYLIEYTIGVAPPTELLSTSPSTVVSRMKPTTTLSSSNLPPTSSSYIASEASMITMPWTHIFLITGLVRLLINYCY